MNGAADAGALNGLKVLDLSRVLAGPWATQTLGDLGATVVKVEQPGTGDGIRQWGPPFLDDGSGDSAYYLCANRNKQSIAIDMAHPDGAALVRKMALGSDVLVENFKVGGLARFGLDYASLTEEHPALIYCSVTGFGQTGPYRDRGGYDFLIQGMSGLMSVTGWPDDAPGGGPVKVGIPVSDILTGLYATIAILAALHHRASTGLGQHIDCSLLDSQLGVLAHQASNYLNGGVAPFRSGNDHASVVPYGEFACADGRILVAIGNDRQFRRFCALLGAPELGSDERFAVNAGRLAHGATLRAALTPLVLRWTAADLVARMTQEGVPAGLVNTIPEILADPHVAARQAVRSLVRSDGTEVLTMAFPPKLSRTPAAYRAAPPRLSEDFHKVLTSYAGLANAEIEELANAGIVQVVGAADEGYMNELGVRLHGSCQTNVADTAGGR